MSASAGVVVLRATRVWLGTARWFFSEPINPLCSHFPPRLVFLQRVAVSEWLTDARYGWQHVSDMSELIKIQRQRRHGCRDVVVSVETDEAGGVRFTLLHSQITIRSVTSTNYCLLPARIISIVPVRNTCGEENNWSQTLQSPSGLQILCFQWTSRCWRCQSVSVR